MQASLRASEWDEVDVRHMGDRVKYVYRRALGESTFVPWVVVAPSAILARLGLRGMGLYAARGFKRDDYIGKYEGRVVGTPHATRHEALSAPATRRLLRRGHDKLVALRVPNGPGFHVLDGETSGPPYIALVNDPRDTGALTSNAELTDAGWLRVVHARVPAFDLSAPLARNARSELRIDYGEGYWALHELLGKSAAYGIECD